jgi:hypothetical protein
VTADHGEVLDEEVCAWQHERSIHDAVLRVPLVIAGPGIEPAVREEWVGLQDVAPTLVALSGLPPWEGGSGQSLAEPGLGRGPWLAELHSHGPGRARPRPLRVHMARGGSPWTGVLGRGNRRPPARGLAHALCPPAALPSAPRAHRPGLRGGHPRARLHPLRSRCPCSSYSSWPATGPPTPKHPPTRPNPATSP